MPEKVLLSVRLVESDEGYTVEVEGIEPEMCRRHGWKRGGWCGPHKPDETEIREALESLQSLYDELYGQA